MKSEESIVVYIHGKGGQAGEADHYQSIFPHARVIGFDYHAQNPWEACKEFPAFLQTLRNEAEEIILIANSIGAYFAMHALQSVRIKKAYFISPIVDMEQLIMNMMQWAGVTEETLRTKGSIETEFGETLSMEYLSWVGTHPVSWSVATSILYGSADHLQSIEAIKAFVAKTGAELTVMENGEHWFHTEEQMQFLDHWISGANSGESNPVQ